MRDLDISILVGKTLTAATSDGDSVTFTVGPDERYQLLHYQDCCENIRVEDIIGDLSDLVGSPILLAEETSEDGPVLEDRESYTWTFYKLATVKGHVTIRFLGESNGYYSERVCFTKAD